MTDEQLNNSPPLGNLQKNCQVIEMLLVPTSPTYSSVLVVNAVNKSNLTSLDLLLMFPSEAGDIDIGDIFTSASATKSATQMTTHLGCPQKHLKQIKCRN